MPRRLGLVDPGGLGRSRLGCSGTYVCSGHLRPGDGHARHVRPRHLRPHDRHAGYGRAGHMCAAKSSTSHMQADDLLGCGHQQTSYLRSRYKRSGYVCSGHLCSGHMFAQDVPAARTSMAYLQTDDLFGCGDLRPCDLCACCSR